MGRVFTPEQVMLGEYPVNGAHINAANMLLEAVVERELVGADADIGKTALRGVLIYGSVAYGTPGTRSDLDVFGQYQTGFGGSTSFIKLLNEVESTHKVGIEPNVWPAGAINSRADTGRRSTLDNALLQHLKEQDFDRWGVGENPMDDYAWEDIVPTKDDLFEYLGVKVDSFSKAMHSPEVKPKDIQRALEAPRALGRKFLQIMEAEGFMEDAPNGADTPGIEQRLDNYFGERDDEILKIIRTLGTVDKYYTEQLDLAIQEGGDEMTKYNIYYKHLLASSQDRGGVIGMAYELTLRLRSFSESLMPPKPELSDDLLARTAQQR